VAGIAFGIAVLAVVAFAVIGTTRNGRSSPAAAGETIFRAGTFDGQLIPRRGGPGGMMSSGMMGSAGCAACHGLDGRGRRTPMFTSPNITYSNLTDAGGLLDPDGSRGPTYTDATLRRAVTQGVDPSGDKLDAAMPRWHLANQEWSALLAYLKSLP
jgi:cytochrome c oxidase subunit II